MTHRLGSCHWQAQRLVAEYASVNQWLKPYAIQTHALFRWGTGGSAQSSLHQLSQAAEIAAAADMQFAKALSHLYSGILLEKLGRGKAEVTSYN